MGPLDGVRVVELSHELSAWAGKLMGDLGADVVVVEPPGGSRQRTYGPFADDEPGPERSLWWWYYNTSKRSVVLDLEADDDRARLAALVADADVLLAGGPLDRGAYAAEHPELVTVAVEGPEPLTDLTLLAAGGPVWMCGYDDHDLPPVRGGGNQGYHTASHWAVIGTLVALVAREGSGQGQHVQVDALAAANVTTEVGSYGWLACGIEAQRQTGRHAAAEPTLPTQLRCADGRYVNAGIIARRGPEFAATLTWLDEHGLRDEFELSPFLEMGTELEAITAGDLEDPLIQQIAASARDAQAFVASRVSAYEFFESSQRLGLAAGIVYSPEEVLADPHFQARGWPTEVDHADLGRTVVYPGAPYRLTATPWAIRARAPHLGEHQHLVGG